MNYPRIAVGALGGTICMTADNADAGALPRLSAQQLVTAVPGLADIAQIDAETLLQLPSPSLNLAHVLDSLVWAERMVAAGAAGIVLTQGTDTLEETAFLLDLLWTHPQPLVVTGAMRTPLAAGADGPANILAAVACAAYGASRGRGVAVVMNNTIHEARWVRKANSMSVETFESPVVGPAGMVLEGTPQYFRPPSKRYSQRFAKPDLSVRVALVETCLGETGEMLDAVAQAGYHGIVIAAYGAGHVSDGEAQRIEALVPRLPIVVSSRTGSGSTAARTYGFSGSEIDLSRRGALFSGWLGPRKARLLLWLLLATGAPRNACATAFEFWKRVDDSD
ncbi:asparaginase [Paraburkholderia sp. RP-4-7]|jgi:L-asparaginase|uniref:Asparaginase n=1 Tax=Paraburkholderia polaris TaxID=2728848 RepID=A0A848IKL4_9BURK|nr:asparaginase [Paraburkholderia polaris]NMM01663.1 asparaginase [Paraburkholderia polaris]